MSSGLLFENKELVHYTCSNKAAVAGALKRRSMQSSAGVPESRFTGSCTFLTHAGTLGSWQARELERGQRGQRDRRPANSRGFTARCRKRSLRYRARIFFSRSLFNRCQANHHTFALHTMLHKEDSRREWSTRAITSTALQRKAVAGRLVPSDIV